MCRIDDCDGPRYSRGLCKRHYDAQWREANREKARDSNRRYEAANRTTILAKKATYRGANVDLLRADGRQRAKRKYWSDPKERQAVNARSRGWKAANKVRVREYNSTYYHANRDTERARNDVWIKENPAFVLTRARNRRAHKKGATGVFTADDWRALVARSPRCYWCKLRFTKTRRPTHDHVIALTKRGPNSPENSVCACLSCNSAKRDHRANPITGQGLLL